MQSEAFTLEKNTAQICRPRSCHFWGPKWKVCRLRSRWNFLTSLCKALGAASCTGKATLLSRPMSAQVGWIVSSEMKLLDFTERRSPCRILSYGIGAVQDLEICWETSPNSHYLFGLYCVCIPLKLDVSSPSITMSFLYYFCICLYLFAGIRRDSCSDYTRMVALFCASIMHKSRRI